MSNEKIIFIAKKGEPIDLSELLHKDLKNSKLDFGANATLFEFNEKESKITPIKSGRSQVALKDPKTDEILAEFEVVAEEPRNMMISPEIIHALTMPEGMDEKFAENGITNLEDVMIKFEDEDVRKSLGISDSEAELLFCQAALSKVPGMSKNISYYAALSGIRNPHDLSLADPDEMMNRFLNLRLPVLMREPDLKPPSRSEILEMIDSAKQMDERFYPTFTATPDFSRGVISLPDMTPVLETEPSIESDSEVLNEGLKFLENITPTLPLPKTIHGCVTIKDDSYDSPYNEMTTQSGLLVSLSGISDPAKDKTEDEKEYSCYTDTYGNFTINMPDKYNMQEVLTITISKKNDMTYAIAGQSSFHKVEFVRRASELLKNEYVETAGGPQNASTILKIISDVRDNIVEAREIEKKLRQKAYYTYALQYKKAEKDDVVEKLNKCKSIIKEEVNYHFSQRIKEEGIICTEAVGIISNSLEEHKMVVEEIKKAIGAKTDQKRVENLGAFFEKKYKVIEDDLLRFTVSEMKKSFDKFKTDPVKLEYFSKDTASKKQVNDNTDNYKAIVECTKEFLKINNTLQKTRENIYKAIESSPYEAISLYTNDFIPTLRNSLEKTYLAGNSAIFEIKADSKITGIICKKENKLITEWEESIRNYDNLSEIELEHNHNDPYETIINKLPGGCTFLKEKIQNYTIAKKELSRINAELKHIEERNEKYKKKNDDNNYFQAYLNDLSGQSEKKNQNNDDKSRLERYNTLISECKSKLDSIDFLDDVFEKNQANTSNYIERRILNFLSAPMDSKFTDTFCVNISDFEDENLHPRALPSVKLMGDGKNEVYLPTDTAPSRMFNYTMVHRLVEPKLKKKSRSKLNEALKIHEFKENIREHHDRIYSANTLGIGYSLNMHQAWVPDGFALGNLLYSLVLAPGEEQRLIVREHKESYNVSDEGNALDMIHDTYSNSQVDNETASFNNAVGRYSSAHSDSEYYSKATSGGYSGISLIGGIGAGSVSSSTNRGSSSANSSQRDSYDEASHAAQNFQTNIKTESERIASANRTSIRVATSEETESVSSRIIANHNHSHVMTVQYWEVSRRYRLETCIDSVELLLFVPLELISFMPETDAALGTYTLNISEDNIISKYNKTNFDKRYCNILKYYDTIEKAVPFRYRSGLNLIKKYSAMPHWKAEKISDVSTKYTITLMGGFCEFDNLSAMIYFNNGSRPVQGILTKSNYIKLERKDEPKVGSGKEERYKKPHTRKETIEAIINARNEKTNCEFTFKLPYGCSKDDISEICINNKINLWKYTLSQDKADMESWEKEAVENYEHKMYNLYEDDESSGKDIRRIEHYAPGLPDCYHDPIVTFTANELYSFGDLDIEVHSGSKSVSATNGSNNNKTSSTLIATATLGRYSLSIYPDNSYPKLRQSDIQKIEETFHHIVSNTLRYSQVIWSSLSDDERILLLEPYTIELDDIDKIAAADCEAINITDSKRISLLNCVNAKNLVGFYGNCMMLPFTFPQELSELLGKTAGDIQDELYRYHSCNFRVPSTVISVPTDGMVGEAVLGTTNVSEKIDITRFWNWKDSDIDHIDLNQSSLNGRSLLENATTKDIDAPTVGVTATEHINGNNLASALIARQQPTFADVYTNTDMRDVMKNADNNASAGREQVVLATSELAKAALDTAAKVGTSVATGGLSGALGGAASGVLGGTSGGGGALSGILGALGEAGLGDANLGKLLKEGLGSNGSLEGVAKGLVGMVGDGESDALKKALETIGGDDLKEFLSNFADNASNGSSSSLAENFTKSISSLVSSPKNIDKDDIINMAKDFCTESGISLSDITSFLGKKLGLF